MKHFKSLFTMVLIGFFGPLAISLPVAPALRAASPVEDLAQPMAAANLEPSTQPPASSLWTEDIGSNFDKGAMEAGFSLGASVGAHIFGDSETHDFALAKLLFGRVMTDELGKDNWYHGHLELLGEIFGGEQFEPGNAYVVGVTPGLRYDFTTGTPWVPFFDAGAGVSATDIGHPDLGGTFQFNLQTGPGLAWFVEKNVAVTIQYRYLHLSSAGLEKPNNGVNTSVFYLGMSCFF